MVVTGLGVVSSIGIGWQEFWKHLLEGKSGITKITSFDVSQHLHHNAGEIKNFNPNDFMNRRKAMSIGRSSQLAIAASKLAIKDSGFDITDDNRDYFGVCIGTTAGEINVVEKYHDQPENMRASNKTSLGAIPSSTISINVANENCVSGYLNVFGDACSAGNYSIGRAYDLISLDKAKFALAGGADGFSRVVFTGFDRMLSVAPDKCQPFDKNRQGMIPGEAGAILFIESLDSAVHRGANIYAEILGYGLSANGTHMTTPNENGIKRSILKALQYSNISPDSVDYISAHGTGTKENDKAECSALSMIFDEKLSNIPVSSIKSMLGHTMGAASAIEAIACCLAVQENKVPPTINYEEPDPECNIDCVPNQCRDHNVSVALNNSQAFGGNNASLVLRGV